MTNEEDLSALLQERDRIEKKIHLLRKSIDEKEKTRLEEERAKSLGDFYECEAKVWRTCPLCDQTVSPGAKIVKSNIEKGKIQVGSYIHKECFELAKEKVTR